MRGQRTALATGHWPRATGQAMGHWPGGVSCLRCGARHPTVPAGDRRPRISRSPAAHSRCGGSVGQRRDGSGAGPWRPTERSAVTVGRSRRSAAEPCGICAGTAEPGASPLAPL